MVGVTKKATAKNVVTNNCVYILMYHEYVSHRSEVHGENTCLSTPAHAACGWRYSCKYIKSA